MKHELLEKENRRLRRQRDRLHRYASLASQEIRRRRLRDQLQGSLLVRLVSLGDLRSALHAWFAAIGRENQFPREESADLAAAIVRRMLLIGTLGLAVAAVPSFLLAWQNFLVREQLNSQISDALIVRRNELLRIIYEAEDCQRSQSFPDGQAGSESMFHRGPDCCPPRHPLRLRQEAVLALAKLDGNQLDLSRSNLNRAIFSGANLAGARIHHAAIGQALLDRVNLSNASLIHSSLIGSRLRAADLSRARLRGANISHADLTGADLRRADLASANLMNAELGGARLLGSRLYGASLLGASNLQRLQLAGTCGDSETKLSQDLERPSHWLERPSQVGDHRNAGCPPGFNA